MDKTGQLLSVDPVAEAEEFLGGKIDTNNQFDCLAVLHSVALHSSSVRQKMEELGDTHKGVSAEEFLKIAAGIGFEIVYEKTFSREEYGKKMESTFYLLFSKETSTLAKVETYPDYERDEDNKLVIINHGRVNSAEIFYNWIAHEIEGSHQYKSSGSFYKPKGMTWDEWDELDQSQKIHVGHRDVRTGFVYHYNRMLENGKFVNWVGNPIMSLVHFIEGDEKEKSRDELTKEKLDQLPDFVKAAIGVE